MIGDEIAALGRGTVRRRRRIVRGDGMVTPRLRLEVKENGRIEILVPGRSRLAPTHPWVTARPHLFEPAYAKDELVRLELKIAGHLAARRAGPRSSPPQKTGGLRLPEPRRRTMRLP